MDAVIEKLCSQYSGYKDSNKFIIACFIMFDGSMKPSVTRKFVERIFKENQIESCSAINIKRLSKHILNISISKLDLDDYMSYLYFNSMSAKLRCIAKFMEKNG